MLVLELLILGWVLVVLLCVWHTVVRLAVGSLHDLRLVVVGATLVVLMLLLLLVLMLGSSMLWVEVGRSSGSVVVVLRSLVPVLSSISQLVVMEELSDLLTGLVVRVVAVSVFIFAVVALAEVG